MARKTTETFLRTLAPRMIIIHQGLKRISGCSLGIVKLCLSFFLWLYQLIMMWMSVRLLSIIMLKVRPTSFRYVTKSFWSKLNFSKYFLSFSRVWRCQRHNVIFFLSSNLCMQIIVKLIFRCIFPNFLVRRANYQLQSFNHIYIYVVVFLYFFH